MSPSGTEYDRALSPSSRRAPNGSNGSPLQPLQVSPIIASQQQPQPQQQQLPVRPRRTDDSLDEPVRPFPGPRTDSPLLQRTESPEPSRMKQIQQQQQSASTAGGSSVPGSRAISPTLMMQGHQGPSTARPIMAAVAMNRNGSALQDARSPSPNVDRSQPPGDAFYQSGTRSPPVQNGYHGGSRPVSSGGSIIVDMLKQKEGELEVAKRREAWMRVALLQASQAGFVWNTAELPVEGDEDIMKDMLNNANTVGSTGESAKLADMIFSLKRDRARIQVMELNALLKC